MTFKQDLSNSGFTLVEIIIIFVLIGILTLWIFSTYSKSTDSTTLALQADVLIAHMRYAQARAMNSSTTWGIRYDSSPGQGNYWLYRDSTENRVVLPGESTQRIELDDLNISVSEGSFTLAFDGWGKPTCSGCTSAGNRTYSLTLSKPDSDSGTLTIVQNTGFIQWQ